MISHNNVMVLMMTIHVVVIILEIIFNKRLGEDIKVKKLIQVVKDALDG